MKTTKIDPWTWQERYGYTQAWRVDGATGLVFLAGKGPSTRTASSSAPATSRPRPARRSSTCGTVLDAGRRSPGAPSSSSPRYLTDMAHVRTYGPRRATSSSAGPPAGTVVQVGALAVPGMMLEVEATAVVGAATRGV